MPEYMPESMSKWVPDRMSKYMPERMPISEATKQRKEMEKKSRLSADQVVQLCKKSWRLGSVGGWRKWRKKDRDFETDPIRMLVNDCEL
jgi:hypothetical protein